MTLRDLNVIALGAVGCSWVWSIWSMRQVDRLRRRVAVLETECPWGRRYFEAAELPQPRKKR
jgi:hypothetical protein